MGEDSTKAQHGPHFLNKLLNCASVSELDLTWATKDQGGINEHIWARDLHYHAKSLRRMYLDKRVALGGAQDFSPL